MPTPSDDGKATSVTRRTFFGEVAAATIIGAGAVTFSIKRRLKSRLSRLTQRADFTATPPLVPHDPQTEPGSIYVGKGRGPAGNVEAALASFGGLGKIIGADDVQVLAAPGFSGLRECRRVRGSSTLDPGLIDVG